VTIFCPVLVFVRKKEQYLKYEQYKNTKYTQKLIHTIERYIGGLFFYIQQSLPSRKKIILSAT
jgi:hypothetical protein